MNKTRKMFPMLALLILLATRNTNAQFGGVVNKVKNKVMEKAGSNSSTAGKTSPGNKEDISSEKNTVANKLEVEFEVAGDNGYASGTGRYSYDMLVQYYKRLNAYTHIRKVGEQGNFHFAKEYDELKNITEPAIENAAISFSSQPYKSGNGQSATQFSSGNNHIYGRLSMKNKTVKEAFGLDENNYKINVDYFVYPAEGNRFKQWSGHVTLYLNPSRMNQSTLDFDIKPSPDNITTYNDPKDKYAYYIPAFSSLHYEEFFPKSGNYKIAIKLAVPLKDEWGKITGKFLETMNYFDYRFDVKDAKTVVDEGVVVRKAIQTGIRFTPQPLPKEWKMVSAAPAVSGHTAARYNNLYGKFYEDVKIVKTYLSPSAGNTWKVMMRNDNIIPAYKYCTQKVFFFVKDPGGNCYYHPCDLRQDYTGGGTYGPPYLAVFDEEKVYVSCNEMK